MRTFQSLLLALGASLVTAKPVPNGTTATAFNPSDIYIESVSYNGSGCHSGTGDTVIVLSDDRRTLTVIYSDYDAYAGPGVTVDKNRQNCLLNIKVHTPDNYRYSVSQTTFHGYEQFDANCSGYVSASYWFSTAAQQVTSRKNFSPNTSGDYSETTTVAAMWPACNIDTMININSQAVVQCKNGGSGSLVVDSIDHTYKQIIALEWESC